MTESPFGTLLPCSDGCGRIVRWCVTTEGRRRPLDPTPTDDGVVVAVWVSPREVRGRYLTGKELPATEPAYVPHERTCPRAQPRVQADGFAPPRCGGCRGELSVWLVDNGYTRHIGCLSAQPAARPAAAVVDVEPAAALPGLEGWGRA